MDITDLERRFQYHRPSEGKADKHGMIRECCYKLATIIDEFCVEGREKSLAITALEEVMFWANASIARNVEK